PPLPVAGLGPGGTVGVHRLPPQPRAPQALPGAAGHHLAFGRHRRPGAGVPGPDPGRRRARVHHQPAWPAGGVLRDRLQVPARTPPPRGPGAPALPGVLPPLDEARDSGQTTVSNQTTLPGDIDLPSGQRPVAFELFVPVYRPQPSLHATAAERRRLFLGWATGQFRAQDFLDSAMLTAPPYT